MRTLKYFLLATLTLTMVGLGMFQAREKDKPKYTIKEVMKMAHQGKDALLKKVASGKADKEEKEKLVELYTALSLNKPPKGDEKDWKERTDAMIKAAKEVVAGDAGADKALGKLVKCADCHKLHKGN